jgi:uncharacterized protein DUF4199
MMLATVPFIDRIGFDRAEVIGYATIVASFLLVFFGVRAYRDRVVQGPLTFGRALTVGLLITLVSSACYVATWELVYFKLAPGLFQAVRRLRRRARAGLGGGAARARGHEASDGDVQAHVRQPVDQCRDHGSRAGADRCSGKCDLCRCVTDETLNLNAQCPMPNAQCSMPKA